MEWCWRAFISAVTLAVFGFLRQSSIAPVRTLLGFIELGEVSELLVLGVATTRWAATAAAISFASFLLWEPREKRRRGVVVPERLTGVVVPDMSAARTR